MPMEKFVPILVSTSRELLPHCAVMMWSVLQCGMQDITYRFHICHNSIPKEGKELLLEWFSSWTNCEIQFTDIAKWNHSRYASFDWHGKETYFGLLAPELFPQYEKMILLDVDLIICKDISQLYSIPLGDHLIAAALDPDFIGQWCGGNREYRRYYGCVVPLRNPIQYIQAGVILMNLSVFRKEYPAPFFAYKTKNSEKYKFDDQDLFNLYCQGKILFLDMRWNVLHDNNHYRKEYVISLTPKHIYAAYLSARRDPWIIHFAGDQKPWNDPTCDYGKLFWDIAGQTPVSGFFAENLNTNLPKKHRGKLLRNSYYNVRLLWKKCCIALFQN